MIKLSSNSTSGTSFFGSTIKCSVEDLWETIGEPQIIGNDGNDKVNFEWECENSEGEKFTIYDWKEYRPISECEQIEFHIGGFSKSVTENAKNEILEIFKNCKNE